MFDLFYHGGSVGGEGGDARRGMGLGLALCRSILRAHGSDIVLTDAQPHGCVFSFRLPAAALPEESAGEGAGATGGRDTSPTAAPLFTVRPSASGAPGEKPAGEGGEAR